MVEGQCRHLISCRRQELLLLAGKAISLTQHNPELGIIPTNHKGSPQVILTLGLLVLCSGYHNPQDSVRYFWGYVNRGVAA
jgi:hypothetical protein